MSSDLHKIQSTKTCLFYLLYQLCTHVTYFKSGSCCTVQFSHCTVMLQDCFVPLRHKVVTDNFFRETILSLIIMKI